MRCRRAGETGCVDDLYDYSQSTRLLNDSLARCRELGHKWGIAWSLASLGVTSIYSGDLDMASALTEESLILRRSLGDKRGVAWSLRNLGLIACNRNDYDSAAKLLEDCVCQFLALGDKRGLAQTLEDCAALRVAQGNAVHAAHLFGAAETARNRVGVPRSPADLPTYNRYVGDARARLGDNAFALAWARGEAMTAERVVAWLQTRSVREDGANTA